MVFWGLYGFAYSIKLLIIVFFFFCFFFYHCCWDKVSKEPFGLVITVFGEKFIIYDVRTDQHNVIFLLSDIRTEVL